MNKENEPAGTGPDSAGQSGADQGLDDNPQADSESVRELADEGQAFEADLVEAVEEAPDPDVSEIRTRQVPVDDVPPEYLEED